MDHATGGTLYIVSTPIGNLADLSPRAKATLNAVAYILCESVLWTKKLEVDSPLLRYEGKGFRSEQQIGKVISDLRLGKSIALVSNAGTPVVSDPGQKLVESVVKEGLPVVHIPGPSAFVSAAVGSGLPTKNILFIGFLPKKSSQINSKFNAAKESLVALDEPGCIVCYVSKYQLQRALESIHEVFGTHAFVSVAREMTKLYEEHKTGTLDEIRNWIGEKNNRTKGEFTLVISPER